MLILGTYILVGLLSALAVKHVADILLFGSIFDRLREFIARGRDRGYPLFNRLNQLFTCLLCMSTQVAIWLAGLPAGFIAYHHMHSVWASLLVGFISTMGIATLAMGLWTALEYAPNRFHACTNELAVAKRRIAQLETQLADRTRKAASKKATTTLLAAFTTKDAAELLALLETKCGDIGCIFRREDCYEERLHEWYHAWKARHPEAVVLVPGFHGWLARLAPRYVKSLRIYRNDKAESDRLHAEFYDQLKKRVSTS